jgi:hypothetical protein
MSILATVVVPAVLPAAVEGLKNILAKWTGGPQATTIDEQIKLQNADVQRLEALAKLENPYGTPSQWVIDLRASFRYIASGIVVLAVPISFFLAMPDPIRELILAWGSSAMFFIFGERALLKFARP